MPVPDIALAASAREWPDRLHRFLLDHGGGRITRTVMSHEQAVEGGFDVLLIDDVCSFLTPRLVSILKSSGLDVVGVYVPQDGPDAKRRLLECGISDVIKTEATPVEILEKVVALLAHRMPIETSGEISRRALTMGVTGASAGVGITEIAVAVASSIATRMQCLLVDLDQVWPSIAQRLDLPLHPNVRTALDHSLHDTDRLTEAYQLKGDLLVLGGRADQGKAPPLHRGELQILMNAVAEQMEVVVADLGALRDVESGFLREFDTLVVVGTADPVGVGRMIQITQRLCESHSSVLTVLNRCPRGFERQEAMSELGRQNPEVPLATVPFDERVRRAAWDGTLVGKGRFTREVGNIAEVVMSSLS